MATTTIPWGDGSGDNIYLTYPSASGDQIVEVSSDANTGSERTKTITFTSGVGNITRQLTLTQEAGVPTYTATFCPSSYDTANSTFQEWQSGYGATNAYTDADSTTRASAKWKNGSQAETKIYWKFDTSSIPVGVTIKSVSVVAKARVTTGNYQTGASYLVVCNGTTEMGTHTTANSTTARQYTLDAGTGWTRESLQNIAVMYHTQRGTKNTTAGYYQQFYGAILTVTYTI